MSCLKQNSIKFIGYTLWVFLRTKLFLSTMNPIEVEKSEWMIQEHGLFKKLYWVLANITLGVGPPFLEFGSQYQALRGALCNLGVYWIFFLATPLHLEATLFSVSLVDLLGTRSPNTFARDPKLHNLFCALWNKITVSPVPFPTLKLMFYNMNQKFLMFSPLSHKILPELSTTDRSQQLIFCNKYIYFNSFY